MTILEIALAILLFSWIRYQVKTGDNSLQGYFEHLKDKYWTKK